MGGNLKGVRRAVLAAVFVVAARVQADGTTDPSTLRLTGLARVYSAVRFFHPDASRDPAVWEAAVERAIPLVRDARTPAALRAAVDTALGVLHDPATNASGARETGPWKGPPPAWKVDGEGVLVVTLSGPCEACSTLLAKAAASLSGRERGVIFDLRDGSEGSDAESLVDGSAFRELICRSASRAPAMRTRFYNGWKPESGATSGDYTDGFRIDEGTDFRPAEAARDVPAVFLLREGGRVPDLAGALQGIGRAAVVVAGGTGAVAAPMSWDVPVAEGVVAHVRVAEVEGARFMADAVVSAARGADRAMDEAHAQLRRLPRKAAPLPAEARMPPPQSFRSLDEPPYPPEARRVLAAMKLWAVLDLFFPYRNLMNEDWDATLVEFLPRFAAARDALEYGRTAAAMAARTHDSHVGVYGGALVAYRGDAPAPVLVRVVEGDFVVTRLLNEGAAGGLRVGDVVVSVDGESVRDFRTRRERELAASTPQALDYFLASGLLRGRDGSEATVVTRGADGAERTFRVPRRKEFLAAARHQRGGDVVRMLDENVGYVDLDRLMAEETDAMFEKLKGARAIIFDMRGYPNGTAWTVAPRLARSPEPAAARFDKTVVYPTVWRDDSRTTETFLQRLPRTAGPRWDGETVMLVDERTISQAEHTGLFFRAANGTRFVGSPTNGANGDVTTLRLPGGLDVRFTGQSVRHPDGRALQRVGLQPDVTVRPTLAGIRAGRDEVLDRALALLTPGATKP